MTSSSSDEEQSPLLDGSNSIGYIGTNFRKKSQDAQSLTSIAEFNRKRKRTIWVLYFTMFVGSISFSIVMASLWPFLRKLDPKVNETFLGWVNAGYSFAQMVSSIVMGYWCEKRNAKEPIYASMILLALGSGLYSYAEAFGEKGIWIVFCGRVLLGLNAGVVAVARAVGSHITTNEERSGMMAWLALWQSIGFSIGPAVQALAKPIGTTGMEIKSIKLYLNIYTAPGFMMIIISIVNFVLVMLFFVENIDNSKERFQKHIRKLRRQSTSFEPIDTSVVYVCLFLWFVCMTIFALNETILAPVVMNEYAWTRSETVLYTSILLAVAGVIAIICLIAVVPLEKRFGGRGVVFSGYAIMLLGFISYLPWGPGYPKMTSPILKFPNGTMVPVATGDGGGCPYDYKWCHTQPQLSFGQFLTGATLVGIGYPVAAVLLSTLFSKIIGPFPQGKYMGWLSGIGSLARVIGPIYVTAVYTHAGMRWTATSIIGLLTLTLILFMGFWRRLIPYHERFKTKGRLSPTV